MLNGITFGLDIGVRGAPSVSAKKNCLSARQKPEIIDSYLKEELKFGSTGPVFLNLLLIIFR